MYQTGKSSTGGCSPHGIWHYTTAHTWKSGKSHHPPSLCHGTRWYGIAQGPGHAPPAWYKSWSLAWNQDTHLERKALPWFFMAVQQADSHQIMTFPGLDFCSWWSCEVNLGLKSSYSVCPKCIQVLHSKQFPAKYIKFVIFLLIIPIQLYIISLLFAF